MEIDLEKVKNVAHYIAVTGIIAKGGRYLICRRSLNEKMFPGKWCVPGGKVEQNVIVASERGTQDHWLNALEMTLKREMHEETNLVISKIRYVSSLAFLRPNGFTTIIISMCAEYAGGELRLNHEELIDHAWVTLDEAKKYDLIDNIYEQLEMVERRW